MVIITEYECEYVITHTSHHLQAFFICLLILIIFMRAFLYDSPKLRLGKNVENKRLSTLTFSTVV